jgi:FtsZ-interacting cell division protein ZipA
MRWLNLSIVVILVAILGLGVATWTMRRERTQLAQENENLQQTKSALESSLKDAREQAIALNEAVRQSEQHEREQTTSALRKRDVSEGLATAAGVRTAMAEYYVTQGKWPESNEQSGALPPESYRVNALRSVAVLPDGRLRLRFASGGIDGHVVLAGNASAAGQVTWRCTSPDIPDIAHLADHCAYQKARP